MFNLDFLTIGFEDKIIGGNKNNAIDKVMGIMLLTKDIPVNKEYVYISEDNDLSYLKDSSVLPKAVFIAAGEMPSAALPRSFPVRVVNLSVAELLNYVSKNISEWNTFRGKINHAKEKGTKDVLDVLADYFETSFALFDNELTVIGKSKPVNSHNIEIDISKNKRIRNKDINPAISELKNKEGKQISFFEESMIKLMLEDELVGYLMASGRIKDKNGSFLDYSAEVLAELLTDSEVKKMKKTDRFYRFLEGIRFFEYINSESFWEDISKFEHPVKKSSWVSFLIIKSEKGSVFSKAALNDFKNIFSDFNMTFYDGVLTVLLVNNSVTDVSIDYDADALEEALNKHKAISLRSNASILPIGIKSEYLMTRETIEILPKIRFTNEPRSCNIERYLTYCMIHYYASHIEEDLGNNKLVYFANPQILSLTIYDSTHKTDLRDVLFTYITNDCNVNKTAEMLHMHRNTVFYKLNKIKDLVMINLDKPNEKSGILFSCQLLRYIEKVQNVKIEVVAEAMPK